MATLLTMKLLLLSLQINCFDCLTSFPFSFFCCQKYEYEKEPHTFIYYADTHSLTPVNGLNCSPPTELAQERPSFWCRQEGSVKIASKVINWMPAFTIPLSQFEINAVAAAFVAALTCDHNFFLTTFLCQLAFFFLFYFILL